jgi:hypothetical protein
MPGQQVSRFRPPPPAYATAYTDYRGPNLVFLMPTRLLLRIAVEDTGRSSPPNAVAFPRRDP